MSNSYKVSDLISKNLLLTTTFGKACIKSDIKQFFIKLCGNNHQKYPQKSYVDELNKILIYLAEHKVLDLNTSILHPNGVIKVLDVRDEYIMPPTKKTLLREKKSVNYSLDMNTPSFNQEVFKNDQETPFETFVALTYLRKKLTSMERGIEFTLTLAQVAKIMKTKRCYYSGVELTLDGVHSLTFDRIDSNIGYISGNVVACSGFVNNLKNTLIDTGVTLDNLSSKEMKNMLSKFIEII